jgi:hypothetical protein
VPAQLRTQDDPAIIERDVRQAMAAGLTGFAVSYNSSAQKRSTTTIANDLAYLDRMYGANPEFDRSNGNRPTLILMGSRRYGTSELATISRMARPHLQRRSAAVGAACLDAGQTLRDLYAGNARTAPDVWLLISWNEVTGGTHMVPLQRYGSQSLDALRAMGRVTG